MSILNLQASYFSIANPVQMLERSFNGFLHNQDVRINQREVDVCWTDRAEAALRASDRPLIVELQLYFSCVVKKRVLFHRSAEFDTTIVNDKLELAFRPIGSAVCDPREFALNHPAGTDLSQGVALRMVPRRVEIDFRRGAWTGQFYY
ncbi:MAG: hypothetical protein OES20_16195 [Gammaproteobacteria bacterium]|nr:hypothetical protein [Gammaproteobacteria bacterium]MDH3857675.1 hypothetical protein [Gammaproteobacteria bacterium]